MRMNRLGLWFLCCPATAWICGSPLAAYSKSPPLPVAVEILEGMSDERTWDFERPQAVDRFDQAAFGFVDVPKKFTDRGLVADRTNPYMLRASCRLALPAGEYRLLLRSRGAARLSINGKAVVATEFLIANKSSHERVPVVERVREPGVYPLPVGHQEQMVNVPLDGGTHDFLLEAFAGGKGLRLELGELAVCVARADETLRLLGGPIDALFTEAGWSNYAERSIARRTARDRQRRRTAEADQVQYWKMRHELARRQLRRQPGPSIPQSPDGTSFTGAIDAFIGRRLERRSGEPAPLSDDYAFIRRITLDTVGVVPTPREIETFFQLPPETRRARVIDRLLDDPRWADNWVGYWQDVLAENPALLKPKLNNTGPFRWWIHQSFVDNKPMDRFVTELVLMRGSRYGGAPAGFAMATMNDAPMAAKAHIIAKAFLGVEMQCARCHDAPYHPYRQRQLFSLGAMLAGSPLSVPKGSSVDLDAAVRRPQVEVTLKPGTPVEGVWPFEELAGAKIPADVLREPDNPRERLAFHLTGPSNERFPQVMVNRLWKRYLGWGLVEPVDDWADVVPSHPELLNFLARRLATNGYDLKHVARLIFNSQTYQRAVHPAGSTSRGPDDVRPARRRMSAEQTVDSLFHVAGKDFYTEPLTLDPEGRRPVTQFINLGTPRRAWQFTSLSNDRDRPALSLPFAQNIVDVLTVFGWRESRQNPITERDHTPTVLQPMVLANSVVGRRITTLSDDSAVTELCLQEQSLPQLVRAVYLRLLSRPPTDREQATFVKLLEAGFTERRVAGAEKMPRWKSVPTSAVSWANHLDPEATRIKLKLAELARGGDPPTQRLKPDWRERMEDMLWAPVNSPEFLFIP